MKVVRGRWTPADRAESIYRTIAFEVPERVPAVSARLRYDRSRAVIDLGLLDPTAFRGWSGSNKEGFVVTAARATPGYLTGPLPAGEWQVLLGLHRVPPEGVEYELELDLTAAEPPPEPAAPARPHRPPPRELPAAPGRRWLAGDLHTHTVHSDGILTVAELACLARERGLDYLALTDHNTISQNVELAPVAAHAGVLLVPGFELTTDRGHANCLGSSRWIDFRRGADDWLGDAEAEGALLSINHPLGGDMAWRQPMRRRPPLVELWHSTWDCQGLETFEWWAGWGAGLPVGGSDFHGFGVPGMPTTWLEAAGDDVVGALRDGRIAISASPDAPVVVRHEGEVVVVEGAGTTLIGPDGDRRRITADRVRLPASPGLFRLVDDGRTLALTP
jgi:hypothetical protein